MVHMRRIALSCLIKVALGLGWAETPDPMFPGETWETVRPVEAGLDESKLAEARDYALTGAGSGMITRHGRLVMAWGDPDRSYDLKSSTKSIGVTALGLALKDGKANLEDFAVRFEPAIGIPPEINRATGWIPRITLKHLATQTAGFEKPGGYTRILFEPGTKWDYSDSGPNWLADCLTRIYREDMSDFLFRRVFTEIGVGPEDLRWRPNAYRPRDLEDVPRREFGSGIHANVDAMARIGYLYLRGGRWKDRQLIPREFVDEARRPVPSVVGLPEHAPEQHGNASDHYGYLWWNNADGTLANVPKDAFWSWGLYDSLILVVPSLDMVVSRAGRSWERKDGAGHYDVLARFMGPLAAAVVREPRPGSEPVQSADPAPEPVPGVGGHGHLRWAPASTIVRKPRGSDNWPMTCMPSTATAPTNPRTAWCWRGCRPRGSGIGRLTGSLSGPRETPWSGVPGYRIEVPCLLTRRTVIGAESHTTRVCVASSGPRSRAEMTRASRAAWACMWPTNRGDRGGRYS